MSDNLICPYCGEVSHIGGLIGPHTNDCPKCGKTILGNKTMLNQDQLNTIGGESSFSFVTTVGDAIEKVDVTLSYEWDDSGAFNECIESVIFKGVDISGCLTEETINALEMEAINKRDAK